MLPCILGLALLTGWPAPGAATADAPTVVTAQRLRTASADSGVSVTVFDEARIRALQPERVGDLLRLVPGLDLVRNGGPGGLTSAFLRGGESDHVLVLFDGVPLNDLSFGLADLAGLALHDVERVEVVRGPQSLLYGSNALGGVIQLFSRRARAPGHRGSLTLSTGSFGSNRGALGLLGRHGRLDYGLHLARHGTDGFSAAAAGTEDDGSTLHSANARVGLRLHERLAVTAQLRRSANAIDIDNVDFTTGLPVDDADYRQRDRQLTARVELALGGENDTWRQWLYLDHLDLKRELDNGPLGGCCSFSFRSGGTRRRIQWQHDWQPESGGHWQVGMAIAREDRGPSDDVSSNRTTAGWLHYRVTLAPLVLGAGLRHDDDQGFGNHTSWRVDLSLPLAARGVRVHGSGGNGFRAPRLGELYGPFGNPALQPERVLGGDLGVELRRGAMRADWTLFYQEISDLIGSGPDFRPVNVARAEIHGHELTLAWQPRAAWQWQLGYTRTLARDRESGARLLRRARDKLHLLLTYRFREDSSLLLNARYVGPRNDVGGIRLPSYSVADAVLSWQPVAGVELFARLENLLDRDYRELAGYATPGRNLHAGVRWRH